MVRRILNYTLLVLLVAGVVYIGWMFFSRFTEKQARALDAVPEDAAVVFEIRDLPSVWYKLTQTNLIWPDIKNKHPFSQLNELGKQIEKASLKNPEIVSLLTQNPLVVSLHQAAGGINFMMALAKIESEDKAIELITGISQRNPSSSRVFQGINLYRINGKTTLHMGWCAGVIVISDSESLLEASLQRLIDDKKFDENLIFQKLNHTVSKTADANIFFQHRFLISILQSIGNEKIMSLLRGMEPYAEMSELDLTIGPNSLAFSGFSSAADSSDAMLTMFKNQQPQSFSITRFVPEKINDMMFMGISDAEIWFNDRESWLKKINKLNDFREDLNAFNRDHDCNLKEHILSWTGNQMVLFNANYDSTATGNNFLIIRINETGNAARELEKLANKLDTSAKTVTLAEGIQIKQLKAESVFSIVFGELFSSIKNPYFIEVEDHVVFCESPGALQRYLSDLAADKVLSKNVTFVNYVNENLSDKANVFYYSSVGKMRSSIDRIIGEKWKNQLEKNKDLFDRFDAFSWQLSRAEGMYYNHIYVRYNPSFKEEENTFWEFALDTTVTMTPQLVTNHNTGAKDIFVQDDDFSIYLISNTGKKVWKNQLEEKIVGDVRQVDMMNNGKLQIAFCTESQLHIIDLKGNYVNGFPVKLSEVATAQFAVFDYESDKNYRFFIPSGNHFIVIDKEGKKVTGFDFAGAKEEIIQPAEFHRIQNKDYIFTVDKRGNLYMLDRKGKSRFEINGNIKDRSGWPVWFEAGKEIENCSVTYSDSLGKIHKLYFNGRRDSINIRNLSPDHYFTMADANADGKPDIVLQEDEKITIHSWNKELLWEHHFSEPLNLRPKVFTLKDRSVRVGILNKESNQVFVINEDGLLNDKFPVTGSTFFMMDDINNDSYPEIVVGNPFGKIFSYTIK